ncbi:MAG: hypothetical protein ACI8RZ_001683 [Myxococcota bacterium]|jgi:hypothetical protein
MRLSRLLTVLALIGFSLACSGLGGEEATPPPVVEPTDYPEEIDHPEELGHDDFDAPPAQSDWERFLESRYDYCDATVLAGMWGDTDVSEAKDAIGRFLIDGQGDLLESKLGWAREHAQENFSNRSLRCHYDQIGFTFDDAVALSTLWGIDSWDAKMRIELKYLLDSHSDTYIRAALREAHQENHSQPDPFETYVASQYEYCDALVLGGYWGQGAHEAKLKIGALINAGDANSISGALTSAQTAAANSMDNASLRCDYHVLGYSYEDAEVLAALWGIDTWDAKIRIEEKYLRDGHVKNHIDRALRRAKRMHQSD